MEVSEFVSKFQNLPGASIGEKRKNLFLLLRQLPNDHDALVSTVTPRNHLENYFRLEILLKLKRTPELMEILKNEEEYLPAKLLKNKWFCQKLAAVLDENSTDFVENVLPFTSFVIRKRLLTKLAVYGTKLDDVYEDVSKRYGVNIASSLLVGCSPEKIEDVMKNRKLVLSPYFQKILYQKHPTLIESTEIHDSVVRYIAQDNIELFLKITEKANISADLGKRVTRRLLSQYKERIITSSGKYCRMLHMKTITKVLKEEDLKQFFFNSFPPSIHDLHPGYGIIYDIGRKLGTRRYKFLLEGVEKVYSKSLYNFPELVNEDIMECMDVEEREKWISIKKEQDLSKFLKTSDSIPLYKNKINVTSSVHGREKLLELMVETCKINEDLNALAEVCEYVCVRHKNDDEFVLRNFLYSIQKKFKLEKLQERHWKPISTIITILNAKNDQSYFKYDFYVQHLRFLFRVKKLTEEDIYNFLKVARKDHRMNYHMECKDLEKILFLKTIEFLPKLIESGDKLHHKDLCLINVIFRWNKNNPGEKISVFDNRRLLESFHRSIADAIKDEEYIHELMSLSSVFENIICTHKKTELRDETIKNFFLLAFRYYNINIDLWLLKHQPEIIFANFDVFLDHILHEYRPHLDLLNYLKKLSDFKFQERTVNYCLKKIEKREHTDKAFLVLAVLATAEKFSETIAPYDPSNFDKIDFGSDDSRERGEMMMSVAKSIKYSTSTALLPTLIKYCKGDLLRYALESLYYRFYHSPENQLSNFINELSSKAVSVRKHSIFLTCAVGTVSDVQKLLQRFLENERNISVQKHLFTASLKYFIKNPSDEFWECVKICMKNLDKDDCESFAMLVNVHQIPEEYKARHIIFVWEILKISQDLDKNRPRLLSSIPSSLFKDFPREFLEEVISENFLRSDSSCVNAVNDFVVSALVESNYKSHVLDTIFTIMRQIRNQKYETLQQEKNARELLHSFVSTLVGNLQTSPTNVEVLGVFSEQWHNIFSIVDSMREHLKLTFALHYLQANKDLQKFTHVTAELLENLVSTYGLVIVDCFSSELDNFLKSVLCCYGEPDENFLQFCATLLEKWNTMIFNLLVIKLLPSREPSQDRRKKLFLQIVNLLRNVPSESIQMMMNLYVLDLE